MKIRTIPNQRPPSMKRLLLTALAIVASTLAYASDRPTDQEILKAAQAQGIANVGSASGQPADPSAWQIKGVLLKTNSQPAAEGSLDVYAQIESNTDLFLEARKHDGRTLVSPTFQSGASISIPGKMLFQRVGLFTRTWEIKFAWNNALPPGKPLSSYENAVSSQSDDGKALSLAIAAGIKADMERQLADSEGRKAKFETDRAAAQQAMERGREKDEADIKAALTKFAGKWLPYTIVTPTSDPKAPISDFRAVRIDDVTSSGAALTLLLGSDDSAKRAPANASIADGKLNFRDNDGCQIEVVPSRKDGGEPFMLFGSRACSVARQHLSIVLEERTPKQVAEFVARSKAAQTPPPARSDVPLPNLKP
jgi:hypothetical protein